MTKSTQEQAEWSASARWDREGRNPVFAEDRASKAAVESTALLLKRMLWTMQDNDHDAGVARRVASGA